jgi:hypothetical protein
VYRQQQQQQQQQDAENPFLDPPFSRIKKSLSQNCLISLPAAPHMQVSMKKRERIREQAALQSVVNPMELGMHIMGIAPNVNFNAANGAKPFIRGRK